MQSYLSKVRNQLDAMAIAIPEQPDYLEQLISKPELTLFQFNIIDEKLPLQAWVPIPTASPLCIFKPTPANPRTSADCPPRPSPSPSPAPGK